LLAQGAGNGFFDGSAALEEFAHGKFLVRVRCEDTGMLLMPPSGRAEAIPAAQNFARIWADFGSAGH
jgi:hypothetical protein